DPGPHLEEPLARTARRPLGGGARGVAFPEEVTRTRGRGERVARGDASPKRETGARSKFVSFETGGLGASGLAAVDDLAVHTGVGAGSAVQGVVQRPAVELVVAGAARDGVPAFELRADHAVAVQHVV